MSRRRSFTYTSISLIHVTNQVMSSSNSNLHAVILAGGKGSRMGDQDKPLIELKNKPLIEWGLQRIKDQVGTVVISVNHNAEKYEHLKLDLVSDEYEEYSGPLVGIVSAMEWINAQEKPPIAILCIPADVPFFPEDLVAKLWGEFSQNPCDVVWCECDKQVQPLFSIWSLSCKDKLKEAISKGLFGPKLAMPYLSNRLITIEPESALDFININDRETLESVQEMIKSG